MSFLRALLSAVASGAAAGGVRPPPLPSQAPTERVQDDRDTILINAAAQHAARAGDPEGLAEFKALTPSEQLAKIEEELAELPPRQRREVVDLLGKWLGRRFIPNPGPQSEAYHSQADILLYGGAGGSGKSALLLGLAYQEHDRSLIMRRQYGDLAALTEELVRLNGGRDGYVGSPQPRLKTADGRLIEFGAAAHPGDEQSFQGRPHDFLGIDEAAQFQESQLRYLMGWVRTTKPGQRKRVVLASNPPLSTDGQWLVDMFAPWIKPGYPKPAKYGELRWFVTDERGEEVEVEGKGPHRVGGRDVFALSRTFIPGRYTDNIYLVEAGYGTQLDNLKEPLRSAIRDGNFMAFRQDDLFQVIPSDWVRQAMARWTPAPPPKQRMTCMGVDVAISVDKTVLAPRRGIWFDKPVVVPGADTPNASAAVGLIVQHLRDGAIIAVDVGGGYGNDVASRLNDLTLTVAPFNGAEGATSKRHGSHLEFANRRAEAWWAMREALNPEGEYRVMLPPDPDLEADLCTPRWDATAMHSRGVYQVESKPQVKKRLGWSPDRGDAVVMSWFCGPTAWQESQSQRPRSSQANVGYADQKRRFGYAPGAKRQTSYRAQGR